MGQYFRPGCNTPSAPAVRQEKRWAGVEGRREMPRFLPPSGSGFIPEYVTGITMTVLSETGKWSVPHFHAQHTRQPDILCLTNNNFRKQMVWWKTDSWFSNSWAKTAKRVPVSSWHHEKGLYYSQGKLCPTWEYNPRETSYPQFTEQVKANLHTLVSWHKVKKFASWSA